MNSTVNVSKAGTTAPAHDLRAQLAAYVAQQPPAKQSFHKGMRIAEWVSLALPVAAFAVALYFSFAWKTVAAQVIPTAWFCLPLSLTPFLILVGLHGIGLRAWPPASLFGTTMSVSFPMTGQDKTLPLRVGGTAVAWGWATIVIALLTAAFWGAMIWIAQTGNLTLLDPLLKVFGGVLGILIAGRILYAIVRNITQAR